MNERDFLERTKEELEQGVKKASGTLWKKSIGYVLAGFGLVAALAWNDAIQTLVKYAFPFESGTLVAKFVYALIITLVVVIISLRLEKGDNE